MQVSAIWRHPLKAHGREALDRVTLVAGRSMPFDRTWAVAHENARIEGDGWQKCANFTRGARVPSIMAIEARFDDVTNRLSLRHPDRPEITFDPDREQDRFLDWVMPLIPAEANKPRRILRLPERGFTDSPFASLSVCNVASHHAVESLAGSPLQMARWRGNIWFEGSDPWAEVGWIGKDIAIGPAVLRVEQQITRCKATTVNTDTGHRDVDTLAALRMLDHQEFGLYVTVVEGGEIAVGDRLEVGA